MFNNQDETHNRKEFRFMKHLKNMFFKKFQKANISEMVDNLSNQLSECETTYLTVNEKPLSCASEAETTFINDQHRDNIFGETVLLSEDLVATVTETEKRLNIKAYLIHTRSGETVKITSPFFTLGKAHGNVDYAIVGNDNISRVHATIVIRDDIYIIDNNSTNKTYVEGSAIVPGEHIKLYNGSLFSLCDETFQIFMEDR